MNVNIRAAVGAILALVCIKASAESMWCKYLPGAKCEEMRAAKEIGGTGLDLAKAMTGAPVKFSGWQKVLYGEAILMVARQMTPPGANVERCVKAAEPLLGELLGQRPSAQQAANLVAQGLMGIWITKKAYATQACQLAIATRDANKYIAPEPEHDINVIAYCKDVIDAQHLTAYNDWLQASIRKNLDGCGS